MALALGAMVGDARKRKRRRGVEVDGDVVQVEGEKKWEMTKRQSRQWMDGKQGCARFLGGVVRPGSGLPQTRRWAKVGGGLVVIRWSSQGVGSSGR